jgi:hypothetical protein
MIYPPKINSNQKLGTASTPTLPKASRPPRRSRMPNPTSEITIRIAFPYFQHSLPPSYCSRCLLILRCRNSRLPPEEKGSESIGDLAHRRVLLSFFLDFRCAGAPFVLWDLCHDRRDVVAAAPPRGFFWYHADWLALQNFGRDGVAGYGGARAELTTAVTGRFLAHL